MAIAIEDEAHDLLRAARRLDRQTTSPRSRTSSSAWRCAKNATTIRSSPSGKRSSQDAPKSHAEKVSWAVEAPDYDAVPNDVTLRQAFDVAMEAETRAHDFYAGAIEYASDDKVAELFEGLRQAEADHQRMLREEMAKFLG